MVVEGKEREVLGECKIEIDDLLLLRKSHMIVEYKKNRRLQKQLWEKQWYNLTTPTP